MIMYFRFVGIAHRIGDYVNYYGASRVDENCKRMDTPPIAHLDY
jgi:hypothetical protein